MKISNVSVGRAVRAARDHAEMTLSDLAEATGINVSALSKLENGFRSLSFAEAIAIADAFDIDIGTLEVYASTFEHGEEQRAMSQSQINNDLKELQRLAIETGMAIRAKAHANIS